MKIEKVPAIVLRRTNYGEADRIVQCITPKGVRSFMAKGVRKPKSKLAGGIELFSVSEIIIRQGRGELGILSSTRMQVFYRRILEDYERLTFAYEVLKKVSQGSELVDDPDWYDVTLQALEAINQLDSSLPLIKTWFYLHASKVAGQDLNIWRDANGDKLVAGVNYRYDVHNDAFVADAKGLVTENHIKILRVLHEKPLQVGLRITDSKRYITELLAISMHHAGV